MAYPGTVPSSGECLPYSDFISASKSVLDRLHARLGFKTWMVTHKVGDNRTVLCVRDEEYGIVSGHSCAWDSTLCARAMAGLGPYIAPDISEVPGFADMRNGYYGKFRVGAHIGIPLRRADGSLFGTICALDPDPQPQAIVNHLPELQLLATCLSTILEAETKYQDEQRRRERAEQAALSDDLTNCLNRRGWEIEVRREEARCRRYGGSSGVIVIDLDDFKRINDTRGHAAGDEILRDTARILSRSARTSDMIARIGGDEFAVLCVGAGNEGIHHLAGRISENLHAAGIKASVGWAVREPNHSIEDAFTAADRMMYSHKQLSKNTGGDSLGLH